MIGSIVIPAHDEASVIRRTLAPLAELAASGSIDVVVAANGCSDATAALAREVSGVRVLELTEPSKVMALNAADAATDRFPRIYLDADISASQASIVAVMMALSGGRALAARPPFIYDTTGAAAVVRCYYRARMRLPSNRRSLWGAGCYGMSQAGRAGFGAFPGLVADDYFVDTLFEAHEKQVVDTIPPVVRVPRTSADLRRVLRRTYSGNAELVRHLRAESGESPPRSGNGQALLRSAASLPDLRDAALYAAFSVVGRAQLPGRATSRQRDESSRRS
ncbi:glycosyltransferase [Nocardioides sp. B-3]|uniref:glycosyltransferase n=1 Tax=Nocardioides sp. B-3 TaxID=2895565 RepID=UPI0021532A1D|nr:glycosyltransferase [Nocardioides sp. B-3]UUZ60413.1 glycosyltransferase [Nocardioides sp. B-3]